MSRRGGLTPHQRRVLHEVARKRVAPRDVRVPHGVYKSLKVLGLLRENRNAQLEITEEGYIVTREAWIKGGGG